MIHIAGVDYPEMADAIYPANLENLPFTPDAYLGYVDGRWPDYQAIAAAHQGKPCFGLTVWGDPAKGDGSDDEPGNTTVAQTPAITQGELARGVVLPIVYCPESWAQAMVQAHTTAGIPRGYYRLLTAHYAGFAHICGPQTCACPVQADGTQWENAGPYDRSILSPSFLTLPGTARPVPDHPGPAPITLGDNVDSIPIQATLDPNGWTAIGVPLPAGKTKDNIVSIVMDGRSPYDGTPTDPWETATAVPDFALNQPGNARIVVKGSPGKFYTGRVFVA